MAQFQPDILDDILNSISIRVTPIRGKTIFSIGGRGHYENPISDLLAFFMNPDEEHGFSNLLLDAFFETLQGESKLFSAPISLIERELRTESDKRIDLVIASEDWVLG